MPTALALLQVVVQILTTITLVTFLVAQMRLQRFLYDKVRIKDFALVQAVNLLRQMRASIIFQGPADEDPLRQAIEQLEEALKL